MNSSETYVHEITKEMVRLAQQYHAYIGVEDISYRKDQPSSSRAENRELFAVPFSTIMEALHNKALLAGLPAPAPPRSPHPSPCSRRRCLPPTASWSAVAPSPAW
jgi:IS605 OrfB family transposase